MLNEPQRSSLPSPPVFSGLKTRVIARLDVKGDRLIKGVQMEGLRVVGDPLEFARAYYSAGIDEIFYQDIVASLYNRNSLLDLVRRTAGEVFIPVTVGGGLRSVENVRDVLRAGADKAAINTAAIRRPELISEVAQTFGSQCMILSIEAKRISEGKWEAFCDSGRERTGVDAIEWAARGQELGAGEIFLTSVDHDGTRSGFDLDLIAAVTAVAHVPVVVSGGFGAPAHAVDAIGRGASAIAVADALHFRRYSVAEIKASLRECGIAVRGWPE